MRLSCKLNFYSNKLPTFVVVVVIVKQILTYLAVKPPLRVMLERLDSSRRRQWDGIRKSNLNFTHTRLAAMDSNVQIDPCSVRSVSLCGCLKSQPNVISVQIYCRDLRTARRIHSSINKSKVVPLKESSMLNLEHSG